MKNETKHLKNIRNLGIRLKKKGKTREARGKYEGKENRGTKTVGK